MNYYDTVIDKIANYIVKEPVEETEEVISAYTLFSALESYNKIIRHTREKGKALVDKLNTIYPQKVVKKKGKLFKKKTKQNYFDEASYFIKDNHSEICLFKTSYGSVTLFKDFDDSDIYSNHNDSSLTDEAYNECIDDIEDIFDELEYLGILFSEEKKSSGHKNSELIHNDTVIRNTIHCEGFDINIEFNSMTKSFKSSINLNKEFDPKGNSTSHYYNHDHNLNNIIEEKKEVILRNTPINIGDLSYMFCMLVLDYRAREEKKENQKQIKKIMSE